MPEEWSDWLIRSNGALRVSRAVRALAAAGFVVAFGVVLGTLLSGERFHHPAWVLIPGIPVVIAGQVWSIAILLSRQQEGVVGSARKWRVPFTGDTLQLLFGDLPRGRASFFVALVFLAEVATFGIPAINSTGSPPQRFAAGVFMAFYAIHAGVSSAELARRRESDFARERGF